MLNKIIRNPIVKNTIWMSGDQILRLGTSFFVGAWTARYLRPENYGILNYALSLIGLFIAIASLSDVNQILVRDITRRPDLKNEALGTAFALKLIGSLIATFLSLALVFATRRDDEKVILVVTILSISTLCSPFSTIDSWFQAKLESKYVVISRNIVFIFSTAIRILLIWLKAPLIAFAGVMALDSVLSSVALIVAYRISGFSIKDWQPKFLTAQKIIKDSWALILSSFAVSIYLKIDQTMLGQMSGNYSVGIYSVAVRLTEVSAMLPATIVASATSTIILAKEQSENEFYKKLQKLFDLMAILAFLFALFVSLFAGILISSIYGSEYSESSNILIVHVWSVFFMCFGWVKGIWIIAENQGTYSLIATSSGVLLNIFLNFILIPKYQGLGAAIATLISYGFVDYFTCFIYKPAQPIGMMMTRSMFANSSILAILKKILPGTT
ncbi:MAG: flippase [Nodosilinea sp.]